MLNDKGPRIDPGGTQQGRSEGTSSVAFELLINGLTLNIKLSTFKLFDVQFLFSENHVFRKQKRTAVYGVMDARP